MHVGKVTILRVLTTLDVPIDRVLEGALAAELDAVVVLGYDKNGDEYFASSNADGGDVVWLMERMKLKLLQVTDQGISEFYD